MQRLPPKDQAAPRMTVEKGLSQVSAGVLEQRRFISLPSVIARFMRATHFIEGKWVARTRLRFQLRRASLNSLGRRSFSEGGKPGNDEMGVVLSVKKMLYTTAMSNKRSLLVLCARIGYNPPRR